MAAAIQLGVQVECDSSFQDIKSAIQESEDNVKTLIDKQLREIKNQLSAETDPNTVEITVGVLKKIGTNMSKLRSGDPLAITSALFDILSGAVSLVPCFGPLIGKAFGLLSYIFGSFSSGNKSMSVIVQEIINEALTHYDDEILRRKAVGVRRAFSVSNAFLSGMAKGNDIAHHEIAALGGYVPIYQGVTFLGILGTKLEANTEIDNEHEKAMAYIKLYCELGFLRYSVLYQMYAVARSTGHSENIAQSIMCVIDNDKDEDKSILEFLTKPKRENALFFVHVDLFGDRWLTIKEFVTFIGLELQDLSSLTEGKYNMSPLAWTERRLYINFAKEAKACKRPEESGQIVFIETEEKNVFLISTSTCPDYNLYMVQDIYGSVRATKNDKDGAEKWKIIQLVDGTYMLSPKKWPGWFMYMRDTAAVFVVGSKGLPCGDKGNWVLERV